MLEFISVFIIIVLLHGLLQIRMTVKQMEICHTVVYTPIIAHRITGGFGRELWRSSNPKPLLKQVPCSRIDAQEGDQASFEYLWRSRLHSVSGQCSVTLKMKKFFLIFRSNCLSSSLFPLVLSLGTTGKILAPSSSLCSGTPGALEFLIACIYGGKKELLPKTRYFSKWLITSSMLASDHISQSRL